MESSRRQQAQADLGMDFAKEDQKREAALAKEQARADKKAAKREKMMNMPSYRLMVGTAKYMDKWFLDPILGFILPVGIGDALTSVFTFPFIYYSLCVVKSILAKTEHSHPLGMVVSTHFRCGKGVKRGLKNGALPFNID